jgi:hypothetical protein
MIQKLQRPSSSVHKAMAELIYEMLHASTKVHIAHLLSTSYSAHVSMGAFYDEIVDIADSLAEQYQGKEEVLLPYPDQMSIPAIKTTDEAVKYLRALYDKIGYVQGMITCSSIINTMDEIKALINSTKYKLLFLK